MLKVSTHKFYKEDHHEGNVRDYLNLKMDNNLHLGFDPLVDMPIFVQARHLGQQVLIPIRGNMQILIFNSLAVFSMDNFSLGSKRTPIFPYSKEG